MGSHADTQCVTRTLVFSIRRDPGTVQASTSLEIVSVIPLPYLTESIKYDFLQMLTGICTM